MTTREIQNALTRLGFGAGVADGVIGPKTKAAIKAFQSSRGLVADGIAGPKTITALTGAASGGLVREGQRVFIDVGHGARAGQSFDPGAVHGPSGTTEHSLNVICAAAMAKALADAGVIANVYDQANTLSGTGRAATGFDVFVSVHHNAVAAGTKAQYACARYHNTRAGAADIRFANAVASAMAHELGIPDKGAGPMPLGVLSGAKSVGVPVAFLIEGFFIHAQTPDNPAPADMPDWSARSGTAAGQAIARLLLK